ncbi:MAG: NAD(P)H-hydrate dehydratase [Actinobacteria bacterium]|nr:NAD(P)H-hydrate dehydratase [Actinomycetota bacterium]
MVPFLAGSVRLWSAADTRRVLRIPGADSDKRTRGVVALRTGSDAFPGAAVLGVEGAWRAGAGYVVYQGPRRAADLVLARRPETVVIEPGERTLRPDAWVIGSGHDDRGPADPGSGSGQPLDDTRPVVVDAGALALLPAAAAPVVATPHEREFAVLRRGLELVELGPEALRDPSARAQAVRETAGAVGGVVLLKGATTLISDGAEVLAVDAGTSWLATAGTGDVLAGAIGAVTAADRAAGGPTPLAELAAAATWLHGRAGRIAAGVDAAAPGRPITALDVAEALPRAYAQALDDGRHGEAGDA